MSSPTNLMDVLEKVGTLAQAVQHQRTLESEVKKAMAGDGPEELMGNLPKYIQEGVLREEHIQTIFTQIEELRDMTLDMLRKIKIVLAEHHDVIQGPEEGHTDEALFPIVKGLAGIITGFEEWE